MNKESTTLPRHFLNLKHLNPLSWIFKWILDVHFVKQTNFLTNLLYQVNQQEELSAPQYHSIQVFQIRKIYRTSLKQSFLQCLWEKRISGKGRFPSKLTVWMKVCQPLWFWVVIGWFVTTTGKRYLFVHSAYKNQNRSNQRKFCMTGGMTNLYPLIRCSFERSFSELFFSDASLWNQYKFVAF